MEEQQQENEELQKELDAQEEEQEEAAEREEEAAEREEEAAEREEMQQEIDDLEKKVEEKESEPEPESDSPGVVIESNDDWAAPPSQAPQGVVVVSPDFDAQAVTDEEAQVLDAAIGYYQEVEVGDYYATHSLLSEDDKVLFPVDTWVAANTNLDSAAGEFVVTDAYPDDVGNGYPAYAVTVAVYLPDGSSSSRTTHFTNEGNGYWAHWLSTDEMSLFNSAL